MLSTLNNKGANKIFLGKESLNEAKCVISLDILVCVLHLTFFNTQKAVYISLKL